MKPQLYVCCVHALQLDVEEHPASAPPDMIATNTIRMCTGRSGTGSARRIIPNESDRVSSAARLGLGPVAAQLVGTEKP
jgi:hypothetical protein